MILLTVFGSANAQIASWTYEPYQGNIATPTSNTGAGTSAIIINGGGTITPDIKTGMTGSGCGDQTSGQSAWHLEPFNPGNNTERNGAQFKASTLGFQNIRFTWDQRWSNTSPNTIRLQYTTNGTTWANFTMTAANTTFCSGLLDNGRFETDDEGDIYRRISVDLSGIAALNNNPNFAVRVLAAHYRTTNQFRRVTAPGTTASNTGTWRFDNVSIEGTPVGPNPSVMSGTTAVCAGGSANIRVQITGGVSPFKLVYSNGSTNFTINNYTSNTNIPVSPIATTTYTIVSVTGANGGIGTGNSGSAVITVNALPAVTATNLSTCSSAPFTFTGGFPAGGTYSIPSPYSGGNTTFTYTYTNANGCSRTVGPYTFTRNTPVSINAQPSAAGQSVCQGSAFPALTVGAAGTGLSYQWYSNAMPSTAGGTPLTSGAHTANGSQTNTYIPLSNTIGTLYYYVQVNGTCAPAVKSSVSGAFVVQTAALPGTASSDQTVCAGTLAANIVLSGNVGNIIKWQKADDANFTLNVSDITSTNAVLTGSDIGLVNQTTYVRAVVGNAGCGNVNSNAVAITVRATTWNGSAWNNGAPDGTKSIVFEGNYISSGNVEACSCLVNSGSVNFQPDDTLTLLNSLQVNGGSMTFESNASLVQINNVPNAGNIVYKRDTTPIRKFDYTYWSTPVQDEMLINISPLTRSDKYFWFDAQAYDWVNANANTTVMEAGKGYILRGPNDYSDTMPVVYHADFVGVPNNGDVPVPVYVNGADNLNLIGNPYPSAIDADLLMSDPANATTFGTGTTIYLWTHNTNISNFQYITSDYASYNYTGGTGTSPSNGANNSIPNGYIASGQSFFIHGIASGTARFTNAMRVPGNNDQFFKSASVQKDRFWLEFKNANGYYKQTLIGYMPNATDGFDNGYDALLFDSAIPINFYSILDTQKLSIQGRSGNFSDSDIVPLGYRANSAGVFEINLMQGQGLFASQSIFLEDLQLGSIHDLTQSSYSFQTAAGTFDDRFRIRYNDAQLGTPSHETQASDIIVFRDGANAVVRVKGSEIAEVAFFDLNGKKLIGFTNVSGSELRFPLEVRNQVVLARIKTADGKRFDRKVLL